MSDYSKPLEISIELVKAWGETRLPNGKTLSEHFTFNGISFWELVTPELAIYQVTMALSKDGNSTSLLKSIRPHVTLIKHRIINYIKLLKVAKTELHQQSPLFLFLGFSGYMYRDVLHPVAKTLLEHDNIAGLVIHDGQLNESYMPMQNVHSQSIWQYWNKDTSRDSTLCRRQLNQAIKDLHSMNVLHDIICFEQRTLWPQMKNAFNWLFNFHFKLLVPHVILAERIFKKYNPSLIISSDIADPRTRLYNLIARNKNKPVLEIQFGPLEEGLEWNFLLADKVAVWGKKDGQKILRNGIAENRIVITGSPRHDDLINVKDSEICKVRQQLGVPEGAKMILLASTYHLKEYNSISSPELILSMKQAVIDAADKVVGVYLVVKPHPLEDVKETTSLMENKKNVVIIDAKEDIRKYIKACDVYVGFGSTVTIDAMVANKLTICPVFDGWIWSELFVTTNATLVPRSAEEILSLFYSISDGSYLHKMEELRPALECYLQDMLYKIDGNSSTRIIQAAIAMKKD